MSSADGDSDVSGGSEDVHAADGAPVSLQNDPAPETARPDSELRHIIEEEQRELRTDSGTGSNGTSFHGYSKVKEQQESDSESPSPALPHRNAAYNAMSPEGSVSTPDDSPSVQVRRFYHCQAPLLTPSRAPHFLPPAAAFRHRSPRSPELNVRLPCSPLNVGFPPEYQLRRATLREHSRPPS